MCHRQPRPAWISWLAAALYLWPMTSRANQANDSPLLSSFGAEGQHAPKPAHTLAQAGRARSAITAQATRTHLRAGCIAV
jgi:hypothetical protein